MKKITIIILLTIFFSACGNNEIKEIKEREKQIRLDQLNWCIDKYSNLTDSFCIYKTKERHENVMFMRKSLDNALAKCADKLDYTSEEYSVLKDKINLITGRLNKCTQELNEKMKTKKYSIQPHNKNTGVSKSNKTEEHHEDHSESKIDDTY